MSVRQLAYDFFESPELRTLFMRATPTSGGAFPDDPAGLQTLVHVMGLVLSFDQAAIVKGGTQAITDALVRAGTKLGVEYFTGQDVDRIVVENGNATAAQTSDGTQVRGSVVVSDLGMPQTYLRLLRDHTISDRLRHRLGNIHYDRGQVLWGGVAMHELPQYARRERQPRRGYPTSPVHRRQRPRLPGLEMAARGLPARFRTAALRPDRAGQHLGPQPGSRGQAHAHGGGVQRPRTVLLRAGMGPHPRRLRRAVAGQVADLRPEHDPRQHHRDPLLHPLRHHGGPPGHA